MTLKNFCQFPNLIILFKFTSFLLNSLRIHTYTHTFVILNINTMDCSHIIYYYYYLFTAYTSSYILINIGIVYWLTNEPIAERRLPPPASIGSSPGHPSPIKLS